MKECERSKTDWCPQDNWRQVVQDAYNPTVRLRESMMADEFGCTEPAAQEEIDQAEAMMDRFSSAVKNALFNTR